MLLYLIDSTLQKAVFVKTASLVMQSFYCYTELRGIAGSSPVSNTGAITNDLPMSYNYCYWYILNFAFKKFQFSVRVHWCDLVHSYDWPGAGAGA